VAHVIVQAGEGAVLSGPVDDRHLPGLLRYPMPGKDGVVIVIGPAPVGERDGVDAGIIADIAGQRQQGADRLFQGRAVLGVTSSMVSTNLRALSPSRT
jgi:hypothetical protein